MRTYAAIAMLACVVSLAPALGQDGTGETKPAPSPIDTDAYLKKAASLIDEGRLVEACNEVTALYEKHPEDPQLMYVLGVCQLMKGSWLMKRAEETQGQYAELAVRFRQACSEVDAVVASRAAPVSPPPPIAAGPDGMILWESIAKTDWRLLTNHIAVSPDDRFMYWVRWPSEGEKGPIMGEMPGVAPTPVAEWPPSVVGIDVRTGGWAPELADIRPLVKEPRNVISMFFLPWADDVLIVISQPRTDGDVVAHAWQVPTGTRIAEFRIGVYGHKVAGTRVLPDGRLVGFSTPRPETPAASAWQWDLAANSLAEWLQWLRPDRSLPFPEPAIKANARQGETTWGPQAIYVGADGAFPLSPMYVMCSADSRLLLFPVGRKLVSGEYAVAMALVDMAAPEGPTFRGLVREWLTPTRHNPVYGADVATSGRVIPTSLPIYAGGTCVLASDKEGHLSLSNVATGQRVLQLSEWAEVSVATVLSRQVAAPTSYDPTGSGGGGGGGFRTITIYH